MDGYDLEIRMNEMVALLNIQDAINQEITDISNKISDIPNVPDNIDTWLDSIPNVDNNKNFKLADFTKMFRIQKKYSDLLEKRHNNGMKIKAIVIDNLIDQIKDLLEK